MGCASARRPQAAATVPNARPPRTPTAIRLFMVPSTAPRGAPFTAPYRRSLRGLCGPTTTTSKVCLVMLVPPEHVVASRPGASTVPPARPPRRRTPVPAACRAPSPPASRRRPWCRSSAGWPAPAPDANSSGSEPRMKAKDVIRIGRKRSRAASLAAWRISVPCSRRSLANSTMRIAFLLARPMSSARPICA